MPHASLHLMPHGSLQARASQAHALMLAEVRAGTRWWNHLRSLNHEEVQLRMLEENTEKWQVSVRMK